MRINYRFEWRERKNKMSNKNESAWHLIYTQIIHSIVIINEVSCDRQCHRMWQVGVNVLVNKVWNSHHQFDSLSPYEQKNYAARIVSFFFFCFCHRPHLIWCDRWSDFVGYSITTWTVLRCPFNSQSNKIRIMIADFENNNFGLYKRAAILMLRFQSICATHKRWKLLRYVPLLPLNRIAII